MKMEQIVCSERSTYKIQTPGNYPEESIRKVYTCKADMEHEANVGKHIYRVVKRSKVVEVARGRWQTGGWKNGLSLDKTDGAWESRWGKQSRWLSWGKRCTYKCH
jgi:hypothetical protein